MILPMVFCPIRNLVYQTSGQPRFQGLSSLAILVVGRKTLVAAGHVTIQNLGGKKICWKGWVTEFSIVTVTNLLRQSESGMSLDLVVFALKSCFKNKHQKSFFILLTQVYVGFVQLYVTEITVITCSVKGTAVYSPWPKRCTESHCLEEIFHTWSVGHAQGD